MEIKLTHDWGLKNRLSELAKNLNGLSQEGPVELSPEFITPICLLPIALSLQERQFTLACDEATRSYLDSCSFPNGVTSCDSSSFKLPILRQNPRIESTILNSYEKNLIGVVTASKGYTQNELGNLMNTIKYLRGELQTNVEEHARTDSYWIMSQYWQKLNRCEICFADKGVGILSSYINAGKNPGGDEKAILDACNGVSSKLSYERGFGLKTLMSLFVGDAKGKMVVVSGERICYFKGTQHMFFDISERPWKGTIIGFNFQVKPLNIYSVL